MKKVVLMPFGSWLLALAAVGALLTPERGTVTLVLLILLIVCGVVSTILAHRAGVSGRA